MCISAYVLSQAPCDSTTCSYFHDCNWRAHCTCLGWLSSENLCICFCFGNSRLWLPLYLSLRKLQRLHPLETPCCSCLTDCFHFIGLIDWRAFAICSLCCCFDVAVDLHHATTLLLFNTPSSSIHIIVLNLRLGLS